MKRKKIFLTLLTIAALMVGQTAWAQNPTTGTCGAVGNEDNVIWTVTDTDDDNTYETLTISGTGVMADYTDQSGDPIATPWDNYKGNITTVVIENGVSSIGNCAFNGCTSLTIITIPNSVMYIGYDAFLGCTNVTDVYCFARPHFNYLTWYDYECNDFITDSNNKNYPTKCHVLADELTTYQTKWSQDPDPNNNNVNVEFVGDLNDYVGPNIKWVLSDENDDGREETLTISGTGTMWDFEGPAYQPWAYLNSHNDITIIIIEDGVTTIGKNAFSGCHELKTVTIPSNVTIIDNYAFKDCTHLTSVAIPSNVTTIGQEAFSGCLRMELVAIGEGVTSIKEDAFKGCTSVTDVYCYADPANLTWTDSGLDDFNTSEKPKCHVSDADDWSSFVNVVNVDFEDDLTTLTSGNCGATGNGSGVQWSYNLSTETLTISGTGAMADYTDQYGNNIDTPWNDYLLKYIKKVVIGDGITHLGDYAFYNGIYITSVTFNATDISIGVETFYNCCRLESITIPANVTSIGNSAFEDCYNLTTVNFADGSKLKTIGDRAFSSCEELKSITIPAGVTTIGEGAFAGCPSLTSIGVDASNNYYTNVDGVLFSKDGKTLVAYPIGKTNTEYSIPDEVTTIGAFAFYGCGNLKTVTFESGLQLTTIGDEAFKECDKLETINNLPTSIIYVGYNAFEDTPWLDNQLQNLTDDAICIGSVLYKAKITTSGSSYTVADNIVGIAGGAFGSSENLTSVTIPASVTYIGEFAFNDCENLETVTFNGTSKLETIGTEAFAFTGLTEITIPASVTSIGWGAFYYCENLATVTFADNSQLKNIDMGAFSGCGIQAITIPASVTTIGEGAFYGCANLQTVTFENGSQLTTIGDGAFGQSSIQDIIIPASVTTVGEGAFSGCVNLATVYALPTTPPTLGNYTFLDIDTNCKFYVHGNAYESASGWSTLNATPIGSVSCANGITIAPDAFFTYDGKRYYKEGTEITLYNETPEGYVENSFQGYIVNGTPLADNPFNMPAEDLLVKALWTPTPWEGEGSSEKPYIIEYPSQLDLLASNVNSGNDYSADTEHPDGYFFKLGNNITYSYEGLGATGRNYTPIGSIGDQIGPTSVPKFFNGTFDGDGKTISGIRLYPTNDLLSGIAQSLFGVIGPTGTVINVNLDDTQITGNMGIGGIVGMNYGGTIKNCTCTSRVNIVAVKAGGMGFGGIAGLSLGNIENCTSYATITTDDGANGCTRFGGIVGYSANGIISNCFSFANITIDANACQNIGGIAGTNETDENQNQGSTPSTIENSTSFATITIGGSSSGCGYIGGIVGENTDGKLTGNLAINVEIPEVNTGVEKVGAIIGAIVHDYNNTNNSDLKNNYYSGCTVESVVTNSGIGCGDYLSNISDITTNDGAVPALAFYDSGTKADDNETVIYDIATNDPSNNLNALLFGRTLVRDDSWNTLCLPFAVEDGDDSDGITFTGTPLEGATVMELDITSTESDGTTKKTRLEGTTLYLNFKDATSIEVGKPYIVKWAAGENIVNPVFSGVTVSSATPTAVTFDGGKFVGNYSPYTVTDTDEIIYLGSKDVQTGNTKIGYAKAGKVLRSFRAHFDMKLGTNVKEINLIFDDSDEDAADAIVSPLGETEERAGAIYNIAGQRLQKMQKGINIVNGKKILF